MNVEKRGRELHVTFPERGEGQRAAPASVLDEHLLSPSMVDVFIADPLGKHACTVVPHVLSKGRNVRRAVVRAPALGVALEGGSDDAEDCLRKWAECGIDISESGVSNTSPPSSSSPPPPPPPSSSSSSSSSSTKKNEVDDTRDDFGEISNVRSSSKLGGKESRSARQRLGSNIAELHLDSCRIRAGGAKVIAEFANRQATLTRLDLSGNSIGHFGAKAIADCLTHESCAIKHLDVSGNRLSFLGAAVLGDALGKNNSLELLNVFHNYIGARGMGSINAGLQARLREAPKIDIDVGSNSIRDGNCIGQAIVSGKLCALRAMSNNLGPRGVTDMVSTIMASLRTENENGNAYEPLECLVMSWNMLGPEGIAAIAPILARGLLVARGGKLILDKNELNTSALADLSSACIKSMIGHLELSFNNEIQDIGVQAIFNNGQTKLSGPTPTLTHAIINRHRPTSFSLTTLRLSQVGMTVVGAERLSAAIAAGCLPHLKVLTVSRNRITPEGARAIAASLSGTRIESLSISSDHSIGEDGASALFTTIANNDFPSLHTILLSNVSARGRSLADFIATKRPRALRTIVFSWNSLDDNEDCQAIADAISSDDRLTQIDLFDSHISAASRIALRRSCSRSQVVEAAFTPEQRFAFFCAVSGLASFSTSPNSTRIPYLPLEVIIKIVGKSRLVAQSVRIFHADRITTRIPANLYESTKNDRIENNGLSSTVSDSMNRCIII